MNVEQKLVRFREKEISILQKIYKLKFELAGMQKTIVKKDDEIEKLLEKKSWLESRKRKRPSEFDPPFLASIKRMKLSEEEQEPDDEGEYPENLLPEEMWREVLKNLDGMDALGASQTCQLFHDILHSSRTVFLFQKVLPFLAPYIKIENVLNCRFVCWDWNSAINAFFEDRPSRRPFDAGTPASQVTPFISAMKEINARKYSFSKNGNRNPNAFIQKDHHALSSPLIGGSFMIEEKRRIRYAGDEPSDDEDENDEQVIAARNQVDSRFWEGIDDIIWRFGENITHFTLYWDGNRSHLDNQSIIELLTTKLLFEATNIQSIKLVGNLCHAEIDADEIPYAPELETLIIRVSAENFNQVNPIIDAYFEAFHNQIKRVEFSDTESLGVASEFHWGEVIELRFGIDYLVYDDIPSSEVLHWLKSFPNVKKLGIECYTYGYPEFTPNAFKYILEIVNGLVSIAPQFHVLHLSLRVGMEVDLVLDIPPNLYAHKQVNTLEIEILTCGLMKKYNHDYSFLLRFPFIKHFNIYAPGKEDPDGNPNYMYFVSDFLSIHTSDDDDMDIVEVHQCLKGARSVYSSNIWEMLPNLQVLKMQNKLYRRQ